MPRPNKRKAAARKRNKEISNSASEWKETDSNGYSSGNESPDTVSEVDSDGEDGERWRDEQCELYSLAYRMQPTKVVS